MGDVAEKGNLAIGRNCDLVPFFDLASSLEGPVGATRQYSFPSSVCRNSAPVAALVAGWWYQNFTGLACFLVDS